MELIITICLLIVLYIIFKRIIYFKDRNKVKKIENELIDSIHGLLKSNMLPIEENATIYLKENEYQVFNGKCSLYEERTSRYWKGFSVRIIKGFYYRVGQSRGDKEIRKLDTGNLIITTKRVIFLGETCTREIRINKIINVKLNFSTVTINSEGKLRSAIFLSSTPKLLYLLIDTIRHNEYVKNPDNNLGAFLIEKNELKKFENSSCNSSESIYEKSKLDVSDTKLTDTDELYDDSITDKALFEKYCNNQKDNFLPIIKYDQSRLNINEFPIFYDFGELHTIHDENVYFKPNTEIDKNDLNFIYNVDIVLTNNGIHIIGNNNDYYKLSQITYIEYFSNSLMIIMKKIKPYIIFIHYPKTFNSLMNYVINNQPLKRFHVDSLTIGSNILPDSLLDRITLIFREEWNRKYTLSNELYSKKEYEKAIPVLRNLIWSTADKYDFLNLCINMSLCLIETQNFKESNKYIDFVRYIDPNNTDVNEMSKQLKRVLNND